MINAIISKENNKNDQNIKYNSKFKHKQCHIHKMQENEVSNFRKITLGF